MHVHIGCQYSISFLGGWYGQVPFSAFQKIVLASGIRHQFLIFRNQECCFLPGLRLFSPAVSTYVSSISILLPYVISKILYVPLQPPTVVLPLHSLKLLHNGYERSRESWKFYETVDSIQSSRFKWLGVNTIQHNKSYIALNYTYSCAQ